MSCMPCALLWETSRGYTCVLLGRDWHWQRCQLLCRLGRDRERSCTNKRIRRQFQISLFASQAVHMLKHLPAKVSACCSTRLTAHQTFVFTCLAQSRATMPFLCAQPFPTLPGGSILDHVSTGQVKGCQGHFVERYAEFRRFEEIWIHDDIMMIHVCRCRACALCMCAAHKKSQGSKALMHQDVSNPFVEAFVLLDELLGFPWRPFKGVC